MIVGDPLAVLPAPALPVALEALKASVHADLAEFRREVGFRLPAALESVSASEIRQHLGPFLEQTFRVWAERESQEVQQALARIAQRALPASASDGEPAPSESQHVPDSRLTRPSIDISTFALDASVVAALAVGIGTLFANLALGGLFLLAAPTLALLGQERGERALRQRAAESGMKAVEGAVAELGKELERVIDDFSRRLPAGAVH